MESVSHTEYILRTEKLSAGYDGKPILCDVTLSVRPGEILTLLGANGAGKSTLLKTLIGQLPPISGAAFLCGKRMDSMHGNEIARTLSIVLTNRVDGELLTVEDVVASGRYPYTGRLGVLSARDREIAADAMRRLRVAELRTRYFQQLSDGQRQRVLLARALCQEPKILLMDEPTSFLDLRCQLDLLSLLRDMASRQNIAVILSTHELDFARRVSDTVACVRGGVLERTGTPNEVLTPDYIERLYDIPPGHFDRTPRYSFTQNRQCEMFPCHTGVDAADFNCLFCYCPLYALGTRCGGNFSYTEKGVKNCKDCNFPHVREHYKAVLDRFPELAALAKPEAPREFPKRGHSVAFEHYVRCGQTQLRCGYTTGTCAALAASGAARLLLTGETPQTLSVVTPKGWTVDVVPSFCVLEHGAARCGVVKDAGDDPDTTNGCTVVVEVRRIDAGITIDGGAGVGRVTKPGLDQSVGAAAINSVPRRMIADAVQEICDVAGYAGGVAVTISVPGGEQIAARTFNPNLGIVGGVSILGTSGIVEPMSEQAVIDSIALEIRQAALSGKRLILTPGNYGLDFLRQHHLDTLGVPVIRFSNYVGDALDTAASEGVQDILLVGHVGKLVKLAGGIMNTHSRVADCRNALFCAYAAVCGADTALCRALMDAVSTDACLSLLDAAGIRAAVVEALLDAVQRHLKRRVSCRAGAVMFSNVYGLLGQTRTAAELLAEWGAD